MLDGLANRLKTAQLLARRSRQAQKQTVDLRAHLIDLPKAKSAFDNDSQLVSALCSRRAGKTTEGNVYLLEQARKTKHGRFVYINETRAEAERLAWNGAKQDGMKSLCQRHGLSAKVDNTDLTICFEDIDSWIYVIGVDDAKAIDKLLGMPYHIIWWDEAQKIPPRFENALLETILPTLLDYGGRMILTGTPSKQTSGLFFRITQPDVTLRAKGWDVHEWTMLDNPYFGDDESARFEKGIRGLQKLLGGEDVTPLDSPAMLRQGFGKWAMEDANYVYAIHKAGVSSLQYAPQRFLPDGFPDVVTALADLPFSDGVLVLGVDLGYFPDPFAFVLYAWHPDFPVLFEVASYKQLKCDSDMQAVLIDRICSAANISFVVADAGGGGKQVVAGWSVKWQERYGRGIVEAKKSNKHGAIEHFNADLTRGHILLRKDSPLCIEMQHHVWSAMTNQSGKAIESNTANHCADASLYAHRESWHHRHRAPEAKLEAGSKEWYDKREQEIEDDYVGA